MKQKYIQLDYYFQAMQQRYNHTPYWTIHLDKWYYNCLLYTSMLKPADGIEGVKKAILETVDAAGPNACPPLVVGVGIGGDFEKCALLSLIHI